ncbi:PspC domain-containing protein [Pseudonocardia sp.]|uniref:PspC domain-containing protein n=1 Tax=Pseudonocardia sp. TaxID=60912 RepID=UPI0039C9771B
MVKDGLSAPLRRSREDRMLSGVCGGLARNLGPDSRGPGHSHPVTDEGHAAGAVPANRYRPWTVVRAG